MFICLHNRAGFKEETEPRWLEPVAVNGTTFDLVQNWDQLSLPPTVSGKTLGAFLPFLVIPLAESPS